MDVGAGQGRNSLPLAEAGHRVAAIDLSHVGLERLRTTGQARGLSVETIHADVAQVIFAPESVDLVLLIYFYISDALVAQLAPAIRPGGAILVEGHPNDAEARSVRLPDRFPGWRVARYETVEAAPDWNWRGVEGRVPVVRFLAFKPGS